MAGVVHIPWYATLFRGDRFAAALAAPAAAALRYGATRYTIHRSRDDAYRFDHMVWFAEKLDWVRYWEGPEMSRFRAEYGGWYQVPVLYYWADEIAFDAVESEDGQPAEAPSPVESA